MREGSCYSAAFMGTVALGPGMTYKIPASLVVGINLAERGQNNKNLGCHF